MSARPKASRRQVVSALIDMLEAGMSSARVARMLAAYLVECREVRNLELYIRDIELEIARRYGVATAYVTAARQLSEKARVRVKQLVESASGAREVELVEKEDPKLIGGIVIKTADAELDGSVRTKLRNLRSI